MNMNKTMVEVRIFIKKKHSRSNPPVNPSLIHRELAWEQKSVCCPLKLLCLQDSP